MTDWPELEAHKAAAKAAGLSLRAYARRRHLANLKFAQEQGSEFAGIAITALEADIAKEGPEDRCND